MTPRQVQLIEDFGASTIMVTPSYALSILDEYRAQGRDPRESPLQVGIFGAEPWTNAMRSEIEQAFDMHAVDIYGLSEVMGPGVANECVETKDGLHIWEDHFYPEIIDPATGEVLPDGEMGELVFTSLTKEAFPIIRYRTRDLTRLLPGTARSMRRMEKVTGRSDDMIILRGVNVFPDPDRGTADGDRRPRPAFPAGTDARGADGRHDRACRGRRGAHGLRRARRRRRGAETAHQGACRHQRSRSRPMAPAACRAARARRCASSTTGRRGDAMPRGLARDHAEKRDALRRGAAAHFAAQGYERASMASVAAACGVSKALIYHYYDSKEALLFDLCTSICPALRR
jgi:hypothetical protein